MARKSDEIRAQIFQEAPKADCAVLPYAGDYEVMTALKNIADEFNITILLVHHTRKEESSDAFNMISGTTGLLGSADGALVLQKPSLESLQHFLTEDDTLAVLTEWQNHYPRSPLS